MKHKIKKSKEKWKKELTPEEFYVLREKGTETAFTGKYVASKRRGIYVCAGCGNELFFSDAKFETASGWPSFRTPMSKDSIELKPDTRFGMVRTEVVCSQCGGHLGHVFDDGPKPTGHRFCINSVALHFKERHDSGIKRKV